MTDPGAPGWYTDPWGTPRQRWYDGAAWTQQVWPSDAELEESVEAATAAGERAVDPAVAPRVLRAVQLGRLLVAVLPLAALATVATTVSTVVAFRWVADHWSEFVEATETGRRLDPVVPAWASALSWFGQLPLLLLQVLFLVWCYQAARAGRDLGHPARRSPGWAVGSWLIPVVNLWWPPTSLTDSIPESDPARAEVRRWWTLWLTLLATTVVVFATAFLPPVFSIAALAAQALVALAAALAARRMVASITASHLRAAQS